MSLSTKPAWCRIHPVAGTNGTYPKALNVKMVKRLALPSLQPVKKGGKLELREPTSRREMMVHFTASSLGFLCLLFPGFAEARPRNADARKKILEKLQELREKAGFLNPKLEENKSTPKTEAEEKPNEESQRNESTSEGSLHLPLPSLLNDKIVETSLS